MLPGDKKDDKKGDKKVMLRVLRKVSRRVIRKIRKVTRQLKTPYDESCEADITAIRSDKTGETTKFERK